MTVVLSILWLIGQLLAGFGFGAFAFLTAAIGLPTFLSVFLVLTGWADNFKLWLQLLKWWPLMVLVSIVGAGVTFSISLLLVPPVFPFGIGMLAGAVTVFGLGEKLGVI